MDLKTQYNTHREAINARIGRVLESGHFILGPEVEELERTLASYTGSKHCLTVASGTVSLEIALRAMGVGPGDEVVTVPFTWISTAEVVCLVGAKPVFVDIEPGTFNMNPELLEGVITPRTKAILPVSLFGQMPDLERIAAVVEGRGIPVLEDAAQSFGATRNGRKSCAATKVGSTSFYPSKPLGCYGDGGALFTDDDGLATAMRAIRTHGGLVRHQHDWIGMNGRFDTLQAAIMLAKWPTFEEETATRSRLGARYSELLNGACVTPEVAPGNTHVYAQYTVRVPERDTVAGRLRELGVPTAVYYPKCLHEMRVFSNLGYGPGDFPESERAAREVLSLPLHPFLSEWDQDLAASRLREVLGRGPGR